KLEAEIDASDQLEFPDRNPTATQAGVLPAIYALESLLYPSSARLQSDNALAGSGTLVIAPVEAPLSVLVWGPDRIAPVLVTDFSVTEEAFDTNLNPIRAKVSLGFRVLSVSDLGFEHRGGGLFMAYLRAKEQLAQRAPATTFATLGIGGLP